MMKRSTLTIAAALAAIVVLTGCKPSAQQQQQQQSETSETAARASAERTDSAGSEATERLTLAKAFELIEPGQKLEPKAIEQLFAQMQLPMVLQEQYISDAEWGGDSQAVSYCFGNNVKFENYEFTATGDEYFGVHTNFFFDESRKTGSITRFDVITSDSLWHARLLQDAAAQGLKFAKNVDPVVYGKKGKLFEKQASKVEGSTEEATYYIFDFSTSGHYDIEVGYDSGIDI